MADLDFSGLRERSREAFTANFDDVARRARRRRTRRRALVAACGVTVAVVLAGVATAGAALRPVGGRETGSVATPTPAYLPPAGPTQPPTRSGAHYARAGAMTAGDLSHLYLHYDDCQPSGCTPMIAASADGGKTWTRRRPPIPDNVLFQAFALTANTVLVWYQTSDASGTSQHWITSLDAGAQWRPVTLTMLTTVPAGWLVLDFPDPPEHAVLVGDPVTGAVGQLTLNTEAAVGWAVPGLSAAAGVWVTGATSTIGSAPPAAGSGPTAGLPNGSVLAVSHDGGASWHRQAFAGTLDAHGDTGGAAVATYDGQTAYAVGEVDGTLLVYRSLDGGLTWLPAAQHAGIGQGRITAAVRADGVLTIQVGDQAADHPIVMQSTDQGQTLHALNLGPGAAAVAVPGGYVQSGWPANSGIWLSDDGLIWEYAAPPALP